MKKKIILTVLSIITFLVLTVVILITSAVISSKYKTVPFELKKSAYTSWDEVFANPGPVTVKPLNTGFLTVPRSGTLNLEHKKAEGIEDEQIDVPVITGIIEHERYGVYLVDAGMDSKSAGKPKGSIKGLAAGFFPVEIKVQENQHAGYYLEQNNLDLKGVFFTHLHFDHVPGVIDFPAGLSYIAGKGEVHLNPKPLLYGDYLNNIKIQVIDFTGVPHMPPFGPAADIFGDGSFWAILTEGHSPAHISYLVNSPEGPVLLTGDACFSTFSFENAIGPGTFCSDVEKAQVTLEKIIAFKNKYPALRLIFAHELPRDF